jgi:mannosyltransferase OCH1-like enzyme
MSPPTIPREMSPPTIPRVFHRIWLEGAMPAEFVAFGETWVQCNPGWEMVLWTPATLPPMTNQAEFDAEPRAAGRSDIARYEILLRFGGVYIDCDFECLRDIAPLLDGVSLFAGWEDSGSVNNAIIGATAGHPVLAELVETIPGRVAAHSTAEINVQHGPVLFTEVVTAHAGADPGIVLYEPSILYPYHYTQPDQRGEPHPEAYAVHHWFGSWLKRHH